MTDSYGDSLKTWHKITIVFGMTVVMTITFGAVVHGCWQEIVADSSDVDLELVEDQE